MVGSKLAGRDAGDLVVQLVERVADGQFRRDLGDRKAGGLGGQRRGTADARVHLDHDHAAVLRVDRELNVRPTGFDPDLAQTRDRGVAHDLVFLVRQGQCRGDRDRIPGVNAHRVDVFDRADDDAVVRLVADDLHLEFLPAENRFLDENFTDGRGINTAHGDIEKFFAVIGDAAAQSAQREGGADDRGQAHKLESLFGILAIVHLHRTR